MRLVVYSTTDVTYLKIEIVMSIFRNNTTKHLILYILHFNTKKDAIGAQFTLLEISVNIR